MSTAYLLPVSNGSQTDFSASSTAWQAVDDPVTTPDDGSTFLASNTLNHRQSVILDNYTDNGTISSVTITSRAIKPTGTASIKNFLRIGGVNYDGAGQAISSSYTNYTESWATNPATSVVWTVEDLEALEAGLLISAISGAIGVVFTQLYATITYTAPYFQINSGFALGGVKANWQRVEKRRTPSGIVWQDYALLTLDIPQMEMSNFLAIRTLQGQRLTSIRATDINHSNTMKTYTIAEMLGVIAGGQTGRRAVNVQVQLKVKV